MSFGGQPAADAGSTGVRREASVQAHGAPAEGERERPLDAVGRLLEESWQTRVRGLNPRELKVEAAAGSLLLAVAVPLALLAPAHQPFDWPLAAMLVVLYAISARMIRFPLGAGYVVPSYLVLVPMLLLLPVGIVPLLTVAGLLLGTLIQVLAERARPERLLFAVADAWHALGPAVVLLIAGVNHRSSLATAAVYVAALLVGYLVDLLSATLRERLINGVAAQLQARVLALVWGLDTCMAPLGLLVADAARHAHADVLLILPFNALLLLIARDRSSWIAQAQRRLDQLTAERVRLQGAVRRLGEALDARLDLQTLIDVVLEGSIEALSADAGRLAAPMSLGGDERAVCADERLEEPLREAARPDACETQLERGGAWVMAVPFALPEDAPAAGGTLSIARRERAFREDEQELLRSLVQRAVHAAADIVGRDDLRRQVLTDPLTGLGNRRKLAGDLQERIAGHVPQRPLVLALFDLNGFKAYNDTFGHQAGDAALVRLGRRLTEAVGEDGDAYRLGGDEFCVLVAVGSRELTATLARLAEALADEGEGFAISAAYGAVLMPSEARTLEYAVRLADERMYIHKRGRGGRGEDQTHVVLAELLRAARPQMQEQREAVTSLCLRVGARLGVSGEKLQELERAAELHELGAVVEPGGDDVAVRQATLAAEVIGRTPALRAAAVLVGSSQERWDGRGGPDGLGGEEIPLGARILAACAGYRALLGCGDGYDAGTEALARLRRETGSRFDPCVVGAMLDELREMAVGLPEDWPPAAAPSVPAGPGAPAPPVRAESDPAPGGWLGADWGAAPAAQSSSA